MPDDTEQQQPEEQTPQNGGTPAAEKIETEEIARDTIRQEIYEARQLVPTVHGIVRPADLAGYVTYAQAMAKSRYQLPEHLHDNIGDCLAIAELAFSRGMLPYAVGKLTYVQNRQLCYMSQLYVAFLYTSDELLGSLNIEWIGEGEEMCCEVSGRLKRDPAALKVLRSMPLKHLRPGRNEKGQVKGSPLWDRKPRQQIAYDCQRDWVRLYAPSATLGLYTPDEIAHGETVVVREQAPGLQVRLPAERVKSGEGFSETHISSELARSIPAGSEQTPAPARPTERRKRKVEARPPRQPAKPQRRAPRRPQRAPSAATVKRAADRAAKKPQPKAAPAPAWLDYVTEAEGWIKAATDAAQSWKRWDDERDERDKVNVPIRERQRLDKLLTEKFGEEP